MLLAEMTGLVGMIVSKKWNNPDTHDLAKASATEKWIDIRESRLLNKVRGIAQRLDSPNTSPDRRTRFSRFGFDTPTRKSDQTCSSADSL